MKVSKTANKTEAQEINDLINSRGKPTSRVKYDSTGKILSVESTDQVIIDFAKTKGLS